MPTLHNPLGWVLSQRQRKTLADIARAHDLVIIEDAAYAYLANRPPPPVAVLHQNVLSTSTDFPKCRHRTESRRRYLP